MWHDHHISESVTAEGVAVTTPSQWITKGEPVALQRNTWVKGARCYRAQRQWNLRIRSNLHVYLRSFDGFCRTGDGERPRWKKTKGGLFSSFLVRQETDIRTHQNRGSLRRTYAPKKIYIAAFTLLSNYPDTQNIKILIYTADLRVTRWRLLFHMTRLPHLLFKFNHSRTYCEERGSLGNSPEDLTEYCMIPSACTNLNVERWSQGQHIDRSITQACPNARE